MIIRQLYASAIVLFSLTDFDFYLPIKKAGAKGVSHIKLFSPTAFFPFFGPPEQRRFNTTSPKPDTCEKSICKFPLPRR